jgi:hypothetical protein
MKFAAIYPIAPTFTETVLATRLGSWRLGVGS